MITLVPSDASRRQLHDFIAQVEELANPDAAAMRPIQEAIRVGFAQNFASEGAAGGEPWAQLAAMTRRERRQQGYPEAHPILERSGVYRRSFTDEFHINHVSAWAVAGGVWTVEEGSTDERADELEYGTFKMPARPVLVLGNAGEARISEVLEYMFAEWFE